MIDVLLAAAVFSGSSPVPGSGFPPPPPPPPVEFIALSSPISPAPTATPRSFTPQQPQQPQQEEQRESWADKFWKRYTENKRS